MQKTALHAVLLALCLLTASTALSQRKTELESLLNSLQTQRGINFSYDKDKLSGVPVSIDTSGLSTTRIIEVLNTVTAFNFDLINSSNCIVSPKSNDGNFLVRVYVYDSQTKEPLSFCRVMSKQTGKGSIANEVGYVSFVTNFSENDSIIISSVGYKKITVPIGDFVSRHPKKIAVETTLNQLSAVTVTSYLTSGIFYNDGDQTIVIKPRQIGLLTGNTNNDILWSLDAIPGISMPDSRPGNLNVRGGMPDQTMITFDQIPLYQKGHLLGSISAVNTNMIDKVNVHRSYSNSAMSGRAGGIIEILSPSVPAGKFTTYASLNGMDGNVYVHAPIVKNKLSFMVAARQALPFTLQSPVAESYSDLIFQTSEVSKARNLFPEDIRLFDMTYRDFNAKIIGSLGEKHKIEVMGMYTGDKIYFDYTDKQLMFSKETDLLINNKGINFQFSSNWNEKLSSVIQFIASDYSVNAQSKIFDVPWITLAHSSEFINEVNDLRATLSANYKFNAKNKLQVGMDYHDYTSVYRKMSNDTTNTSLQGSYDKQGNIYSFYTNYLNASVKNLFINAGIRFNYYSNISSTTWEPRLAANYKIKESLSLKSSYTVQKQFIVQCSGVAIEHISGIENTLWMLADNNIIPIVTSDQIALGALFDKNGWLVDLEFYGKNVRNLTATSIAAPNSENPFIHGNIDTYGGDILVRKSWKDLDVWTSYTYSKSTMDFDSIPLADLEALYDQTHVLDIGSTYRWHSFKFSLAWKLRSGLPTLSGIRIPLLYGGASQPGGSPPPPPIVGGPGPPLAPGSVEYVGRFPIYHSLDLSAFYEFPKQTDTWKGAVGLSIINVYDQDNIINQVGHMTPQGLVLMDQFGLGFTPNIVINFSF